jgi:cobalt-zinc-cadmium efflux system outer membrane protein
MTRPALAIALAGSVLSGCASMKPRSGFDDVQATVHERAGRKLHWRTDSAEDAQADAAVDALLDSELQPADAVQLALLNNRELQALYEELNIAQADVVRAGLLRNPVFSGEVRFATDGGGAAIVLDAAQDFVSLLSMPLRKGRAAAAFEAAKLRVTAEVLDMAFEVETAFYDFQAAEQAREMRETVLTATGASLDLAERLRAAGNNRALDVSNERALHEQSRLDLAAAEADLVRARERMTALMGLWGERASRWRAPARMPTPPEQQPPSADLERRAIAASLDLAILRRQAEIAARSAGIARPFGWLDDADVGVAAEREAGGDWSAGPSLAVPIPLFDQGQAAAAEAHARYRQARARAVALAVEIRSRVRAASSDALAARDRTRYLQRVILPLRADIVAQTQLQYNAMQVSAFQLLQARRDQIAAGADYLAALHAYWRAQATLDQLLRGRLAPLARAGVDHISSSAPGSPGERGHP